MEASIPTTKLNQSNHLSKPTQFTMARTRRSSSVSESSLPKYFGKHGFYNEDPNKIKKNGAGRHNWGTEMDELDYLEKSGKFNINGSRRHSNSQHTRPDFEE